MNLHPDHERRIAAAWAELGTRMAQRQSVIQLYMTVVIAVSGVYLSQRTSDKPFEYLSEFFLLSITMITFISAILIGVHDRVITKLKHFMACCEQQAFQLSVNTRYVFYFSDGRFQDSNAEPPASFHGYNQYAQKAAFFLTFAACNLTAIVIASEYITRHWIVTLCIIALVFALLFLLAFEVVKNSKINIFDTGAPLPSQLKAPAQQAVQPDANTTN